MTELKYENAIVLAMGMIEARREKDRETENYYAAKLALYSGNLALIEADAKIVLERTE